MSDRHPSTAAGAGDAARAAAGSLLFRNLATGFRYPDGPVYAQLAGAAFWEQLREAWELLELGACDSPCLERSRRELPPQRELESAYLLAFEDVGGDRRFCSLYEGSYRVQERYSDLLIELNTLYEHFGLTMAAPAREQPDHITAELEFMHFLGHKQAELLAAGGDTEPYLRAQHDLAARHLRQWIPALARRADELVREPLYRHWTRLTAEVVARWPSPAR